MLDDWESENIENGLIALEANKAIRPRVSSHTRNRRNRMLNSILMIQYHTLM